MLAVELARQPADGNSVELDAGVGAVGAGELLSVTGGVCDHVRVSKTGVQGDGLFAYLVALEWDPVEDEHRSKGGPAPDDRPCDPHSQQPACCYMECRAKLHGIVGVEHEGQVDTCPRDAGTVVVYPDVAVVVLYDEGVKAMTVCLEPGPTAFGNKPVVYGIVGSLGQDLGFLGAYAWSRMKFPRRHGLRRYEP